MELRVAPDEAIWDAAQKAGHLLPYGCLQGWCLSCAGRVLEGDFAEGDVIVVDARGETLTFEKQQPVGA